MEITTKYITVDDFKTYFGIDLDIELKDDSNSSNKAIAFLKRIEDRLSAYLNAHFYQNIDLMYPIFSDYQKEHYQLALLEQAIYIFRNGDISVDSGAEMEGVRISRKDIETLSIAPNCKNELILCGLWCRHIGQDSGSGGWFIV